MDDWDSTDVHAAPAAAVVNQWADEDVDDSAPLDSWDAEPEEEGAKAKADDGLQPPEKKKAVTKRALQKKEEEERKLAERMAAARANDPNLAAAERARLKALEESRDAALAGDLFGMDSLRVRDATSDLPGSASAAASSASASAAASSASASAAASSSAAPAAAASVPLANDPMKGASQSLSDVSLDSDADVDRFVSELSKRLEKLGKSALASKRIARLIMGITDESAKLGVLRLDDVGELKRVMAVRHTELTAKQKKGDKKGAKKQETKPVATLARNAFMHGDIETYQAHGNDAADDYDFI